MLPAVLLIAVAAPSPAAAHPSGVAAKAFVDGIYARWTVEQKRSNWRYQPPDDGRVFAPELAALYAKDARLAAKRGEIVAIEAVELCACQDDGGLGARTELVSAGGDRATVRVRLSFAAEAGPVLTLRLVRLRAGWRIADLGSADDPSLLRRLHAALDGERE